MAGSVSCLVRWARDAHKAMGEVESARLCQDIGDMWLKLVQGLRKVCLDQREEVRNRVLSSMQMCLTGVDEVGLEIGFWPQFFEMVIFTMLDDLAEIAQGNPQTQKEYQNIEGTLVLALKLLVKVFLHLLQDLSQLSSFCKLWRNVIGRMEKYVKLKVKRGEKLQELVPELLKNILFVMKARGVLVPTGILVGDNVWEQTWLHVNKIFPNLQSEVFPNQDSGMSAAAQNE